MLFRKVGAYPSGASIRISQTLDWFAMDKYSSLLQTYVKYGHIKLGWKGLSGTNTLAYYKNT